MRRLDYDYVYSFFEEKGCRLLDTTYKNNSTKMKFRCKCGNIDMKSFQTFNSSSSCTECSDSNSLQQLKPRKKFTYNDVREFIENNSDCLLLSTEYINNSSSLIFLCECGSEFKTSFAKFKERGKRQCNSCSKSKIKEKFKFSYEEVKRFIETESSCILASKAYTNNSQKLELICGCGEEFSISFQKFKNRSQRQCYDCGQKIKTKHFAFDIETVRKRIEASGCELLSDEYKNARESLNMKCECGECFSTTFEIFQRGKTQCNKCTLKQSKLSLLVEDFLKKNEINYESEYRFDDCRNVYPLPFDYAILNGKDLVVCLIEVDGKQHFEPVEIFGGEEAFLEQQQRDKIKDDYCKQNNINLLRIPYFEENNIEEILTKHLISLGVFIMQ